MAGNGQQGDYLAQINVTPFVDVMLVLLIIFMVTAPMMVQGVNVSLPEATSEPLASETEHLMVTVDKDSNVYINDYRVELSFLREKLSIVLENRRDRSVYLQADRNVPYGVVVRVMSEIKGAGVAKLGMVTRPLDEQVKDTAS